MKIKEYIQMVVVLTAIAAVCGLLLSTVKEGTEMRIREQVLYYVKGPAVKQVLEPSSNDLIKDRVEVEVDGREVTVFVGKKEGQPWAIAFESTGVGFGGDIGVMVGYNLDSSTLTGIGITTHKETPGLGSRVSEPSFRRGFEGRPLTDTFKAKQDEGTVDGVSGATYSSRGVCEAVRKSVELFPKIKEKVLAKK
jgi:electron transport complex protein RnfG